jgi:hypothetical protein
MTDERGLYITVAQMQFFLNRRGGQKKFDNGDAEFVSYYNNCLAYNVIYDMQEKDPNCAIMYWDSKLNSLAYSFPLSGTVAKTLTKLDIGPQKNNLGEEEDDDDLFNLN